MAKESFVLYKEWLPIIKTLPDAARLKFYDMMFEYDNGEVPVSGDPHLDGVAKYILEKVAVNNKKYAEKCDKAALAAKMRWDANAYGRNESHTDAMREDAKSKVGMLNDNVNGNDILSTPLPPSSPEVEEVKKKKRPSKTREETTKDAAVAYYKTECEAASTVAPGAEAENYRLLALEICGKKSVECPNGMVNTLMRLPEQLSFDQYRKLCEKMGGHVPVRDMLIEMHTSFDEHVKSKNTIYGVCNNWYNRRVKAEAKHGGNGSNGQPAPMVARAIKHGPHGD